VSFVFQEISRREEFLKIRIAFSDYLNSIPLGWDFLFGPLRQEFEVTIAPPAVCADRLSRGEVDIALIPSIEYQRIPGLIIIPGISVASSSKVRSVLMLQSRTSAAIRSVALDTSSRTSVALARLLLENRMGLRPRYAVHAPDLAEMLLNHDAAVLIGDRALRVRIEDYATTDLAEAWIAWQKRPFVFALWACRSDLLQSFDPTGVFVQAKGYGLQARSEIAARYSATLGLAEEFLNDYLFRNVDYSLDKEHIEGLEQFFGLAYAGHLIPGLTPIRFADARPLLRC
jgi:chorismate dehydratase